MVLGGNGGRLGRRAELTLRTDMAIEVLRGRVEFIVNVRNRRVRGKVRPRPPNRSSLVRSSILRLLVAPRHPYVCVFVVSCLGNRQQ